MEYVLHTLPNELRVVYKPSPADTRVSHCCLMIQAGARDEEPDETGMAHFTEHLLFKGTEKRNTVQILNRLEVAGGDLNAFTTKEYTCITASFLNEHAERALELISDMIFHSTFPEEEIEKEKGVVTDEIDSYQDVPEEQIQDDFDEWLFEGHPLGNNILGKKTTVASFSREKMLRFYKKNYQPANLILGFTGSLSEKKMLYYATIYFGQTSAGLKKSEVPAVPEQKSSFVKRLSKPISQVHAMMGGASWNLYDIERTGMMMLNNLLGGPGMSSKLNLEIREKKGICYTIESSFTPFRDTGLFSIYFGTETGKAERCLRLIQKELAKLSKSELSSLALHQAKQRFKGQIALAEEARASVLISICKSIMDYGKADSLPEIFAKIDAISSAELLALAKKQFNPEVLNTLIFEPIEQ